MRKFQFLAVAVLVAVLTPVAGITYFAVGYSLVDAENRVVERKYANPPFVQNPHGFWENVVTAGNTIPVIGKSVKQVRDFVVILWPVYYIGGTVVLWLSVQLLNAIAFAGTVANWLSLV